ncbi:hypothetical protein C7M84_004043 [Penaeus vannamei]|uniref:Integrase catalytic domain-containing protein n=1 Tax=Penaeus vannamei TaxID=6689 RepID=A0A3R7MLE6_PENVA|nr:hypothetical protein C7M84_004043 [Penaeus vannamei]
MPCDIILSDRVLHSSKINSDLLDIDRHLLSSTTTPSRRASAIPLSPHATPVLTSVSPLIPPTMPSDVATPAPPTPADSTPRLQPLSTIVRFDGSDRITVDAMLRETEEYVAATYPALSDRSSSEFSDRCLQHVLQRLDQTSVPVRQVLTAFEMSKNRTWDDFKTDFRLTFAPKDVPPFLQTARMFNLRPASFSPIDLHLLGANIRSSFDRMTCALCGSPNFSYFKPIADAIDANYNIFQTYFTLCTFLSALPHGQQETVLDKMQLPKMARDVPNAFLKAYAEAPNFTPASAPTAPQTTYQPRRTTRDFTWVPQNGVCWRCVRSGTLLTATVRTVDDLIAGDAPLLPAVFEGRPAYFFVDSGSAVSLVPLSTLVNFNVLSPVCPSNWCVRAASRTSLKVMGEVKLNIVLSGKNYAFPFVVVDDAHLPGDLLLGYNFMRKAEIRQQPDRDTVTHQGNVYRLTTPSSVWHSSSNPASTIAAVTSTIEPPTVDPTPDDSPKDDRTRRSPYAISTPAQDLQDRCHTTTTTHSMVPVRVTSTDGTALITPDGIRVKGLCALPAIYEVTNGTSVLHLINATCTPVRLRRGTRVCDCEVTGLPVVEVEPPIAPVCNTSATTRAPDAPGPEETLCEFPPMDFAEGDVLRRLLKEFPSLLPTKDRPLGRTDVLRHRIDLIPGTKPIYIPSYRIPHSRRAAFKEATDALLAQGIIEPSQSPWSAPMLLVPKKDGSLRPVIDYRRLNAATVPDRYPIPTIRTLLQEVGLIGDTAFLYLDDLLIASKNIADHERKLKLVFQRLADANLTINVKKCQFFRKRPNDKGFYRPFIEKFGIIAEPLTRLLKKDAPFTWTGEQQQAFEILKQRLTEAPILSFPDFNETFYLATDASSIGLGAALMQRHDGRYKPIAFASRKLNQAESNYSVTDLEALAVVWALKHFREIILGYNVHVLTDHRPLKYILTDSKHVKGRQARWLDTLLEFNPKIDYMPGSANKVADALSRNVSVNHLSVLSPLELQAKQRADPLYADIIAHLEDTTKPRPTNRYRPIEEFYLRDGLLFRKSAPKKLRGSKQRRTYHQLVIPEVLVPTVLKLLHESHTSGHQELPNELSNMSKAARSAPLQGTHCRPSARTHLRHTRTTLRQKNRNRYLLVMIDSFSRYTELAPIPDKSAQTVARAFLSHVICRHGAPEQLMCDNGTEFTNQVLKGLCKLLNIDLVHILPYRPQANGLVERLNRTILNVLRTTINTQDNEWDLWIPITQAAINSTFHSSLGDIPNYVVYGDDQRLPYELLQQRPSPVYGDDYAKIVIARKQEAYRIAREHLRVERHRIIAQQHKLARRKEIAEGVLVFHRVSAKFSLMPKLAPDFEGPLRVLKVRHNKALCQNLTTCSQTCYHFDTLKLASTHYEDEYDRQRSLTRLTPTDIAPDSPPATSMTQSSPEHLQHRDGHHMHPETRSVVGHAMPTLLPTRINALRRDQTPCVTCHRDFVFSFTHCSRIEDDPA